MPPLKPIFPHMFQSNALYQIQCPSCNASYAAQTIRKLQRRYREHVGNKGPVKIHLENCQVTVNNQHVKIIGRENS